MRFSSYAMRPRPRSRASAALTALLAALFAPLFAALRLAALAAPSVRAVAPARDTDGRVRSENGADTDGRAWIGPQSPDGRVSASPPRSRSPPRRSAPGARRSDARDRNEPVIHTPGKRAPGRRVGRLR